MLIDEFLPEYDFEETHSIEIDAEPPAIYEAALDADFSESFIVRALLTIRGMSSDALSIRNLSYSKFRILAEEPAKELLIGLAGRFWMPWGDLQNVDAANFREFRKDGYAKAAWNFSIDRSDNTSLLKTATRIKCIGASTKRYFGFYWTFVQPFSGVIRMEMLKSIKRKAEAV